jgi:hypothetical protein
MPDDSTAAQPQDFELTDVPQAEVKDVAQRQIDFGATRVEITKQDRGGYTVRASYA